MQTFLPYPSFSESAKVLDNKRLGKQRVEAYQILRVLLGESTGWKHHPAVKMWEGYEGSLCRYAEDICREWISRGFKDSILEKLNIMRMTIGMGKEWESYNSPEWLGDKWFHTSHRSNLLRKDPIHYGKFGWTEPSTLPYVWPK